MKVAVFGDMHGNSIGLEAVLRELELEPVDHMVCLGDTMQGGVQPRQVMERLQEIGCPVVLGILIRGCYPRIHRKTSRTTNAQLETGRVSRSAGRASTSSPRFP